eukprot:728670-Pleurochrysis_carterae.AAC.4
MSCSPPRRVGQARGSPRGCAPPAAPAALAGSRRRRRSSGYIPRYLKCGRARARGLAARLARSGLRRVLTVAAERQVRRALAAARRVGACRAARGGRPRAPPAS